LAFSVEVYMTAVPIAPNPLLRRPWQAHYDQGVPHQLIYPEAPVFALLEGAAKRFPQRVALEFLGLELSYAQLLEAARRFANALVALGVLPGDRVAIMLPNTPQFVIAFYGTLMAGAVAVNTSPLYVAPELASQLKDAGAETLVVLDLFYPRYLAIEAEVPLKRVIITGIQDFLPFPKNMLYPVKARRDGTWVNLPKRENRYSFKALLEKYPAEQPKLRPKPDDLALLQYTGGTTGTPKGAMLSHRNLMANVAQVNTWYSGARDGQEVLLAVIPFFHVYGMTVGLNMAVKLAATMILLPRFSPKDVLAAIGKHKPTLFPGVPTMYVALNNHPEVEKYDLTSIKMCLSGAAPLPLEVAHTFNALSKGQARLLEGYGLTETSPCTHCNPVRGEAREGSIGLPLPGIEARVVDENGTPLAAGEVGELILAGPNIMQGYWQRPEESAKCLKDGWLYTGDMAKMDEDGYFYIVDRKKDMIAAGGFKVYPREVEEVLYSFEKIKEAVVAGIPDPYRGETVKAFVVLKDGVTATEAEVVAFCKQKLSAYKVPKAVEFRSELPKTLVGKILRRLLIAESTADASGSESSSASTGESSSESSQSEARLEQ
jgi:long-chain acyl-CoA synthetase